jgi:hypothetical protein
MQIPTRNVVFRTNEPATAADSKRVGPFSRASLLPLLYAHILIPLNWSSSTQSVVRLLFCRPLVGRSPCHSAGDGTSSRAKCTHCLSSGSDCIFTESTKVCSLPLVNALLWLSTWLSQTRGPPKRYVTRFVIGVSYLISNLSRKLCR